MSEFNARVAEMMGVEPEIVWIATDADSDDNSAYAMTDKRDGPFYHKGDIERWIAEHPNVCGKTTKLGQWKRYPHFDTDANADYSVLVFVREKWDAPRLFLLGCQLDEVWAARSAVGDRYVPENATYYHVGDYARAALAARERGE